MLINRRCNRDSLVGGVHHWVNAYPQNISFTLADSMPSGTYQIRDLYSNEHYVTSDKIFRQIKILAGRGRAFELKRLFMNAMDILSDTVNICSNITVPSGKTLTFQANSIVKFYNATYLLVQGKLTANGTTTQHIRFTSAATNPTRGSWNWIKFDNYASNSLLTYCDIEYAQQGLWVAGGNANPNIQHCDINQCSLYGARIETNGNKTTFRYNTLRNNGLFGLFLISSNPTILNITAIDNDSTGLFCSNSSPKIGSIETMIDVQSRFGDNGRNGIRCTGGSGSSPWIYRNSRNHPYGGYVRLTDNGYYGLRADSGSQPNLGESSSSPGYNSICDNGSVEIWNGNSSYAIKAKYNWWGLPDGSPPSDSCNNSLLLARPYLDYDPGNPTKGGFIPPLAIDDTSHISQLQRGEIYLAAGELEQALAIFESIIGNDPKSDDAKYALSDIVLCYRELGWQDQIVPYLDKMSAQYQNQELGYWGIVQSLPWLEIDAKYDEAIKRCEILQQEYQSNQYIASYLPFQMAMIYKYGLNNNKLAIDYFSQFLNDSPDQSLAMVAKYEIEDCKATIGLPKKQVSEPVVAGTNVPNQLELYQNYPNPFNPETTIRYQLPEPVPVKLVIYNLRGQTIRTLIDATRPAGNHIVRWDGKDDQGQIVASGVYLYGLQTYRFREIKKMVLVR